MAAVQVQRKEPVYGQLTAKSSPLPATIRAPSAKDETVCALVLRRNNLNP